MQKYFNQLTNGTAFTSNTSDFTTYLQGNAGGKYKAEIEVRAAWWTTTNESSWYLQDNFIRRSNKSFADDGFSVGDSVTWQTFDTAVTFTGTVSAIYEEAGLYYIEFGSVLSLTGYQSEDGYMKGTNTLTDINFKFGLIQNSQTTFSAFSAIDGNIQEYNLTGATATAQAMVAAGTAKTWQNGSVTVKTNGTETVYTENTKADGSGSVQSVTAQLYVVEHEFILLPYFTDGEQSNIQNVQSPSTWSSGNALKYMFEFTAANALNDPNTYKTVQNLGVTGNTGWINESFNGGQNDYAVTAVAYTDKLTSASVDGLQVDRATTVTCTVTGVNFETVGSVAVMHSKLPEFDEYRGGSVNGKTYETNFIYETLRSPMDGSNPSGDIIENLDVNVGSVTSLNVTFDVNYNAAEQALIVAEETEYFLSLLIQDHDLAVTASNQVMLKLDSAFHAKGQFGDDIDGLLTFDDLEVYQHNEDYTDAADGHSSIEAYVEDKVLSKVQFTMDWTGTKQPKVNKVTGMIVVENTNTGEYFTLQKESFITSNMPVVQVHPFNSGKGQVFDLNATRGFQLSDGNEFNFVKITNNSFATDQITYDLLFAFAFNWQDYTALSTANTVFYDTTEENNGLNLNTSHYFENPNTTDTWTPKMYFDFDVTDTAGDAGNLTTYRYKSASMGAFWYDTDTVSPSTWTVVKQLRNQADTDTGDVILTEADTKVFFEFTSSLGDVGTGFVGIVRIEEYENGGLQRIFELSTIQPSIANNILKPLSGDTFARITKSPSNTLTLECQIDKNKIDENKQYQVTARIMTSSSGETYVFEDATNYEFEDSIDYDFNN